MVGTVSQRSGDTDISLLLPPSTSFLLPVPILKFCFGTVWSGPHVELVVRGRGNAADGG